MPYITTDLDNNQIFEYMKSVATMGTTDIYQLQIPHNPYFRESERGEFDDSYLIPTDGVSGEQNIEKNKDVLNQFIFEYDGKEEFEFKDSSLEDTENSY